MGTDCCKRRCWIFQGLIYLRVQFACVMIDKEPVPTAESMSLAIGQRSASMAQFNLCSVVFV